jgi:hypothetical protein
MKITIHVNGMTFTTAIDSGMSAKEAKESVYENIEQMHKLEMTLDDGTFLVMGKEALSNSILIFSDSEDAS